jgi:hypothetical protein
MKNKSSVLATLCVLILIAIKVHAQGDVTIFKQIDRGEKSLYMELLIKDPTKQKLEKEIESLVKKYKTQKSLQIDIFDDLEALQRRADEKYPNKLIYKHWLVSITDKEVHRFYLKERLDIR